MNAMQHADVSEPLASIKHMFGSDIDEDRIPVLIQAGIDCLDMNIAARLGIKMSAQEVEMAALEAHDRVVSLLDSVSVAMVSMAFAVSILEMPESTRAALESLIQLNIAHLEDKFFT